MVKYFISTVWQNIDEVGIVHLVDMQERGVLFTEEICVITDLVKIVCGLYMKNIVLFIRPSLDGTYYGMALSVRPSVRPSIRPSVRPSVRPTVSTKKHRCKWRIFFKFCTLVCLGVPSINLLFVLSYLIKYAHNSIISDFSIFGFHRVIF